MVIANSYALPYVTALAKAEVVVRPIVRRLGLKLRDRVLLIFASYGASWSNAQYISELDEEVQELSRALQYVHLLAEEVTQAHFNRQTVELGVRYSRERGAYGTIGVRDAAKLATFYRSKAIAIANGLNEEANKAIRKVIANGLKNGSNERQVTRNLQLAFNRLGITGQTKYNIATIARTQTQLAFSAGKFSIEQRPEVASALWGYTYYTVGDDKVRPEHELIDGVSLPKHYAFWKTNYPPNGWNCRCQVIAEFTEQPIKRAPKDYTGPDEGFDYNPGVVFSGA